MKKRIVVLGLLSLLAVAMPASAGHNPVVAAAVPRNYTATNITITQGEHLVFANLDVFEPLHSFTHAPAAGAPLFDTGVLVTGEAKRVEGIAGLAPGTYTFRCLVWSEMTGTLTVTPNPAGP